MRMLQVKNWLLGGLFVVVIADLAQAQQPSVSVGIPIDHQLTINKCGGCHQRDDGGMMRRLSYIRTTPEVWEQAIKRMVRLNDLVIKPEEAREILRKPSTGCFEIKATRFRRMPFNIRVTIATRSDASSRSGEREMITRS